VRLSGPDPIRRAIVERTVLVTGATGFLGQELLFQLLTTTDANVICLVRAGKSTTARHRVEEIAVELFGPAGWAALGGRVSALRGDLTQPDLGLGVRARHALADRVTHVVHGAASVRFDHPLSAARRINVQGTVAMLDLAAELQLRGRLQRFAYVSTAFVSGRHPAWFAEDDLEVGQAFRNSYERSKFEAELEVRARMRALPCTVVRPSIVVGNSRSGATTSFNVIYWPLRAYADGMLRYAPSSPNLPVDVVPVDFVARGVVAAVLQGDAGETYALAAGARATQACDIGDMAARVFVTRPPRFSPPPLPRFIEPLVSPLLGIGPWKRFGSAVRQYLPYFLYGSRFDTTHADALLRPRGIEPPPANEFLEPVLEFARNTDFGRDRAAIEAQEQVLTNDRLRVLQRASARSRASARAGSHPPSTRGRRRQNRTSRTTPPGAPVR